MTRKFLLIGLLALSPWVIASDPGVSAANASQTPSDPGQALFEKGMAQARTGDFFGGIEILREAADHGHVEAMLIASSMLIDGTFYEEGLALLDRAVATGDPRARLDLVRLLLAKDPLVERPVEEAKPLLETLVEEGYPPALFLRATIAASGHDLYPQDEAMALEFYRQAAEAGSTAAQQRMYLIYKEGLLGQAVDIEKADEWLEKREKTLLNTAS